MNDKAILLFAKVSAVNAEIEAMKACSQSMKAQFCERQKTIEAAIAEFQRIDLRTAENDGVLNFMGNCSSCKKPVFDDDDYIAVKNEPPMHIKCARREELFQKLMRPSCIAMECHMKKASLCNASYCPKVSGALFALDNAGKLRQFKPEAPKA